MKYKIECTGETYYEKISRKTQIIIASIIGIVFLLIIAFLLIKIRVPDVSGKSISEASKIIKDHTFKIETDREYSPHCDAHLVLAIDWRAIPLMVLEYFMAAYCSVHIIFKILTIIVGVIVVLYLWNLPYRKYKYD